MTTLAQPASQAVDRRAPRILVVDDERSMRELLAIVLKREGYDVLLAENGRAAVDALEREPVDLLISDIKMPDMSGVDVLRAAKKVDQDILGIMITAFASTETAVEAMRLGACDYLSKPFDIDLLKMKVREKIENRQLRQENVLLKRTLGLSHQFANIIGRSETMIGVFKMVETVSRTNSTILLTGESGTGKGLVAQAIHFHSLRREKPMVSLNCGALPETLLESELFGHMRGAFTGADQNKKGLLEVAERGTVFLDEIGDMPLALQVKLLRVLQDREVRPIGSTQSVKVDVRIISATHRNLEEAIKASTFREDLYYRLHVVALSLPALSQRREDIPVLANHFLKTLAARYDKALNGFAQDAMEVLIRHSWPGNVRELYNVVEQAVALATTPIVTPGQLESAIRGEMGDLSSFESARFDFERGYLARLLKITSGNVTQAARLAKRNRTEFYKLLQRHHLEPAMFKEAKT
jgi:two-component system response regulator GlrR